MRMGYQGEVTDEECSGSGEKGKPITWKMFKKC